MKQLVTINLTTKTSDWEPPLFTFGESITLAFRFLKTVNGNDVEPRLTLSSAKASIGQVDARPGGGKFALQFGAAPGIATTAELSHDCTPAQLAAAINAQAAAVAAYGAVTVKKFDDSWLLRFGTGAAEVPVKVVANSLWPVSFGRIMARQFDNVWIHELRLVQAPVAFVSTDGGALLPDPPTFSIVQPGGSSGAIVWDTVQQLAFSADFRGAYRIKKGFQRTALLAPDAGPAEIQAALIAAFGDTFTVTLPFSYHVYIDLGGQFAGLNVPALEVEVGEAPAGDVVLTIPLDRAELASVLRALPSVTLPLEVRIIAAEDAGDPQEMVVLSTPVTIQRTLAFPELDTVPTIDWLRRPSPTTYVPAGTGNIFHGERSAVYIDGDGATTTWDLAHAFNTRDVQVFVRLNIDGGRQLIDGTDFTATVDDENHVTVTSLIGAPAAGDGRWRISVRTMEPADSFAADLTVTEDQVIGLNADLAGFDTRLNILESLLPGNALLPAGVSPISGLKIEFPQVSEILFARDASGAAITDPTKLPTTRAAYLLPAIHKTSDDGELPDPLPAPVLDKLYVTTTGVLIPGGGHIRSSKSKDLGYVGADGRILYPVTKSGVTDSYFPTPFERILFERIINNKMFSSGMVLQCLFQLALQLINADCEAQWMLAIETGAVTTETDGPPNTFDLNLLEVDWNTTTPVLLQQLNLTNGLTTHGFGCSITNSAGTYSGSAIYYKRSLGAPADSMPAANNTHFAIRGRLFNFDTVNNLPDARGWVSWSLLPPDNGSILGITIA